VQQARAELPRAGKELPKVALRAELREKPAKAELVAQREVPVALRQRDFKKIKNLRATIRRGRLAEALHQEALQQELLHREALQQELLHREAQQQELLHQEAQQQEALHQEALQQELLLRSRYAVAIVR
jgi:hypothetical protein